LAKVLKKYTVYCSGDTFPYVTFYYQNLDLQRMFLRSIIVGDIANPLPSFDSHAPAWQAYQALLT
jgi:hypothetical protein